jgi:CheY-like chemotaxis protein
LDPPAALDSAKVTQALLAGRKLLLADDSITIQKVVELTFADEGVSVVCVNNGKEAIERLEEFVPDIVLADVFMPLMNGYEVCEYIKQNDKLKHIPVMLLVGSFEPFDETEARRVGANDTLTKPFQSIRRLMDKVGLLVSGRSPEELVPTAELPKPEEIQVTTADTQPLPAHLKSEGSTLRGAKGGGAQIVTGSKVSERYEGAGEVLLDLGDYEPGRPVAQDDFVLDIDLDDIQDASPVESAFPVEAYMNQTRFKSAARDWKIERPKSHASESGWSRGTVASETPAATTDQLAETQEFPQQAVQAPKEMAPETIHSAGGSAIAADQVSAEQLSPEVIDAIARRAVEHLSERVIQEIAWEVVPPLAELLIKRQLEEKSS